MAAGITSGSVTIADVAELAGVSIRTVSRVLNQSTKVKPATREVVERAIDALSFSPSARARGLSTGKSYLIGVVHNESNALVLDAVQRGAVRETGARGYELVVHPTPTGGDASIENVLHFVRRSSVDGLIVLPPVSDTPGLGAALRNAGVPAFAISSVAVANFTEVLVSPEREAAADVARYLLGLGHRRIAFISGPSSVHSARERRSGFVTALAEAGCGLIGEAEGDYGFDSGVEAGRRLLTRDPAPTAIFAANDVMAAGVLKAASGLSVAVPGALSVVGFDGGVLARMLTPALTSIHRPYDEMAEHATAALLDIIEHKPRPFDYKVNLELTPAESTAPLSE